MQRGGLPEGWDRDLPTFPADAKGMATREASGKMLNVIAEKVPWLLGGSADLSPSTKTQLNFDFTGQFQSPGEDGDYRGRNFHFGIREHVMCAIANGLRLSKLRHYAASFLIFTYYCRGALRLSAMMALPVITGSEVGLIVAAQQKLQERKIAVRIVSMPSWELFEAQSGSYKESVLPPDVHALLAVEAGATQGWHRYVGQKGDVIGVDRFGASAPGPIVMRDYGFNVENVRQRALALLG